MGSKGKPIRVLSAASTNNLFFCNVTSKESEESTNIRPFHLGYAGDATEVNLWGKALSSEQIHKMVTRYVPSLWELIKTHPVGITLTKS